MNTEEDESNMNEHDVTQPIKNLFFTYQIHVCRNDGEGLDKMKESFQSTSL